MDDQLFELLQSSYAVGLIDHEPAPRQFVAATFRLRARDGASYFCKVIEKPLFVAQIIGSLPALADLHALGCAQIGYPIRTRAGALYLLLEPPLMAVPTLVVLYHFIDAPQSYDYDLHAFGALTAQIHQLTPGLRAPAPQERFYFEHQALFEEVLGSLAQPSDDAVVQALRALLAQHQAALHGHYARFLQVAAACRAASPALVITHGDAPGNVLVTSASELAIIDWDDLLLAPPERDLWFLDQREPFLAGYRSVIPGYQVDIRMRSYAILRYYFNSLVHYLSEILPAHAEAHRRAHLASLAEYLDPAQSWIAPHLAWLCIKSSGFAGDDD
jgi:hypothetical protein